MSKRKDGALTPRLRREGDDDDQWSEIRNVYFGKVTMRRGGKRISLTRIEAYFRTIVEQAAAGDVNASEEAFRLTRKLQKNNILDEPAPPRPKSWITERIEKWTEQKQTISFYAAAVLMLMLHDMQTAYEAKHGPLPDFDGHAPPWINYQSIAPQLKRWVRQWRKPSKGRHFDVGYGKPPMATRWPEGTCGNLSRTRLNDDGYNSFRQSSLEKQTYKDGSGKTVRASKTSIACIQVFAKALNGNARARRLVRQQLATLEELNMLVKPPQVRRLPRARPPTEEGRKVNELWIRAMTLIIKRDMLRIYNEAYGPVPPFETRLERQIKGWTTEYDETTEARLSSLRKLFDPSETAPTGGPECQQDDDGIDDYEAQANLAGENDKPDDDFDELTLVARPHVASQPTTAKGRSPRKRSPRS